MGLKLQNLLYWSDLSCVINPVENKIETIGLRMALLSSMISHVFPMILGYINLKLH